MPHTTPLSYHFKQRHFWFDISVLALLFVVAAYVPILKIVPLVACLELFSFFSFHLLAKGGRFQLQGFLGGFVSSTAVFVQVLNDKKFAATSSRDLLQTLLLAVCAMLTECLFILYFLTSELPFIYYVPVLTQLLFFAGAVLYVNRFAQLPKSAYEDTGANRDFDMLIDHPIVWKNVAKLALIILTLVSVMHFIGNNLGFSRDISTLLVSLFEAHAILASVVTEWSLDPQNIDLLKLVFVVLVGNTLSKSYLAFKGKNLSAKPLFIALMISALALSVGVTFIGNAFLS